MSSADDIKDTEEAETVTSEAVIEETTSTTEPTEVTQTEEVVVEGDSAFKMRWYVVQAFSGYEGRVQKNLLERIALAGLEDKFGDILVPTEDVVEMRAGQKRKSSRKFFPGYVLVKMFMDDDTWHLVRKTPRVLGFIGGTSMKPAPITEKEAMTILDQIEQGVDKPKPKTLFEAGEVIRVIDGPFADFSGVVEEVDYEKSRLTVAVEIFGRSTPVELGFGQIEKG
jgi:transcriptional antiterminator NusG